MFSCLGGSGGGGGFSTYHHRTLVSERYSFFILRNFLRDGLNKNEIKRERDNIIVI